MIGTREVEKHLAHPAMFPEQLPSWLLRLSTPSNATIMDPFMGSGTTGIACLKAGRRFVGIEINPRYCDEAISRFEREFDRRALQQKSVAKVQHFRSETVRNNTIIGF
jgi:site-specific DNA-methyltransferase (adenine-specific)